MRAQERKREIEIMLYAEVIVMRVQECLQCIYL